MTSQHPDRRTNPRVVRLPGFIVHEDTGLGTAIKRATTTLGIKPCATCAERAARLDNRITFSPRQRP